MRKYRYLVFLFSALLALGAAGCRSGRYYRAQAAQAAREYLLANAPKVEIGEPKELVKERIIRLP